VRSVALRSVFLANSRMFRPKNMILLSLFLLSMAASDLRADEASQKPSEWERQLEMLRSVPYIAFSVLLENGDLAVIKKDYELLRLSWDSRPLLLERKTRDSDGVIYWSVSGM
jgi:hypothetical protein